METCIIFNPTARGEKARKLHAQLGRLAAQCRLKPTAFAGAARSLAAEAVREGFTTIIAAGGDGTVNEVVNGVGDANGFSQVKIAILPLGTVNVFAQELGLPKSLEKNWAIITQGAKQWIDLPMVEFHEQGKKVRRSFVQLAGAGLDARAIAKVNWEWKKKFGQMAYIAAGFQALREKGGVIEVQAGERVARGELVLIGNGQFYGGKLRFFPQADRRDGLLDVCVFPKVNLTALAGCGWGLLTNRLFSSGGAIHLAAEKFTLKCPEKMPLELDGDNVGELPATFSVEKQKLCVVVPLSGKRRT